MWNDRWFFSKKNRAIGLDSAVIFCSKNSKASITAPADANVTRRGRNDVHHDREAGRGLDPAHGLRGGAMGKRNDLILR